VNIGRSERESGDVGSGKGVVEDVGGCSKILLTSTLFLDPGLRALVR
jgi:hypothetical protein